jgi:hypothetical protein
MGALGERKEGHCDICSFPTSVSSVSVEEASLRLYLLCGSKNHMQLTGNPPPLLLQIVELYSLSSSRELSGVQYRLHRLK